MGICNITSYQNYEKYMGGSFLAKRKAFFSEPQRHRGHKERRKSAIVSEEKLTVTPKFNNIRTYAKKPGFFKKPGFLASIVMNLLDLYLKVTSPKTNPL